MSTARHAACGCPPHKRESVLSFDGGGIRGLASLFIVRELLILIRRKELRRDGKENGTNGEASTVNPEANSRQLPLACHYFSFMFGTSTGGIIAIMLGRLRMDIEECILVYRDLGTRIFAKKQPLYFLGQDKYDYRKLEQLIKDVARERRRSRPERDDIEGPRLYDPAVINATQAQKIEHDRKRNRFVPCRVGVLATQDFRAQRVHMFRSYHNPTHPSDQDRNLFRVNLNNQENESICEVARATSAAPYYFRSIKVRGLKYLDGGLMANNPSRHAWAEANSMHLNHPSGPCPDGEPVGGIRFFVSIGTGKRAEEQVKSGKIRKALSLINKGVQSITETEETHKWMQATVSNNDIYYRFNVETGLEDMKLDDCRIGKDEFNITYHEINAAVADYLQDGEVRDRLEGLAKRLVDNRRQKCKQNDRGYHDLCVPGPLYRTVDDRFHDGDGDEDVISSPIEPPRTRIGSVHRPANGVHELTSTTVQEMPTPASVSELYPQSPPQSPTTWHDTPFQDQQEFSSNNAPRPHPPPG